MVVCSFFTTLSYWYSYNPIECCNGGGFLKKHRIYRSEQEGLRIIMECRQSGLADRAWCEQHNISSSSFYNAAARLRKKACQIPEPEITSRVLDFTSHQEVVKIDICPDTYPEAMAPEHIRSHITHLGNPHTIELTTDNLCLKVTNSADPTLLVQILQMMRIRPC